MAFPKNFSYKFNPFIPTQIARNELFSGREEELQDALICLKQTSDGSPSGFLVVGERGIGKSSLLVKIEDFDVANNITAVRTSLSQVLY